MDKIVTWSIQDRAELFREAANRRGMSPAVIEKDFWVCWTLGKLFSSKFFKNVIMLKGGTSLSKVFGLIERFSEDIDLILDWNQVVEENPLLDRSKTKQDQFNKQTIQKNQQYLRDIFLPEVQNLIQELCMAGMNEDSLDVINVQYPSAFEKTYLRPEIRLEIGVFAAWLPNDSYAIHPYAAEVFPAQFKQSSTEVKAIKAKRTFWEKATILHCEAHRPENKIQPTRHSRHYYDLMVMAKSPVKGQAFEDISLLHDVVEFKKKFYPCGWAHYDLAIPGTFKLMPPEHILWNLQKDYKDMKIMFFGQTPEFEEIMASMEILEKEINTCLCPPQT